MRYRYRLIASLAVAFVALTAWTIAAQVRRKPDPTIPGSPPRDILDVYFVDVEGGQATLFVSPSGESMLVDAGFPGERDAGRIAEVAERAGVKQIDYFVNTHYHSDHVGGLAALAAKIPVRAFVDHGANSESLTTAMTGRGTVQAFDAYVAVRNKGKHILVRPGDSVPIKGLDVQIVSSAANVITGPMSGAGAPNPACAGFEAKDEVKNPLLAGENAQSVGIVVALGRFRLLDLGDLTWNYEHRLVCPGNLLGAIDVYLTTHHGMDTSNLPALIEAVAPRVAIMNNGARKGGAIPTFQTLRRQPGRDVWQLHFAIPAGVEYNSIAPLIANLDETTAHFLKVTARQDGSFTVTNGRNDHRKDYPSRQP
jgi:beta-lactamase superfamily II metal-dependent hydrolase